MRLRSAALIGLMVISTTMSAFGQAVDGGKVYEQVKQAAVEVLINGRHHGSAWFADKAGLIITAAHVVPGPRARIEVISPEIGRVPATVLAVDKGHDLALLSVPERANGYPTLKLAEKAPTALEDVYVFGAPIFRHGVMMHGTVARNESTFEYYGVEGGYVEVAHVAAIAPPGSSGGAWVNTRGEVVGTQSGQMTQGQAPAGVAFMIPLSAIKSLLQSKITARTPTLGLAIEETWQQHADYLNRYPLGTEGMVVKILHKDGPADRAGVQQSDLIQRINDKMVRWPNDFLRIVRAMSPGQSVKLTILKPDGTGTVEKNVTLGFQEVRWTSSNGN